MKHSFLLFLCQAALIAAQNYTTLSAPSTSKHSIRYIYAFGDSYTAIAFNISGVQPNPSSPLGNPTDDHGTSAAGPIWVEYLTETYNTSLILTYDFAVSGGAIPNSLVDQIMFQYEPKYSLMYNSTWNSTNSIFMVWIGINDITLLSLLYSNDIDWNSTLTPRFEQYFGLMDNLYNTGARKFLLVNIPPLDRAPMIRNHTEEIVENFAQGVQVFNEVLLPAYMDRWRSNHTDGQMLLYDAHSQFNMILDHPQAYGFKDNTCMNSTNCFWWNNYHPETAVHQKLAREMATNLTTLGW